MTKREVPRVIAIDGPAGSGKSTVARAVADRLELEYLDTGAMYRGVAHAVLRRGIDPTDRAAVAEVARVVSLDVTRSSCLVDGEDASVAIRGPEVTGAVSAVAANPDVRVEMVARQRTAAPEVRARRRAAEVPGLDVDAVAADIRRRDEADSSRTASPLVTADGAQVLDTSELTVDGVVDAIVEML